MGDVNTQFGLHIDEETYNTVGGYVLGRLGRRARVGDTIDVEGRRMRVEQLDGLRVARVWLSKPGKALPRAREDTEVTETKNRVSVLVSSVVELSSAGTLLLVPHDHAHDGAHGHSHIPARVSERTLRAALVLTLAFVTVEALCGWFGPSLALLSDAGHNLADAASLGFSWYALSIANKRSHHGMTFGYHRVGVLAALANAVSLVFIALLIGWEAIDRIRESRRREWRPDDRRRGRGDRRERRDRALAARGRAGRHQHPQRLPASGRRRGVGLRRRHRRRARRKRRASRSPTRSSRC